MPTPDYNLLIDRLSELFQEEGSGFASTDFTLPELFTSLQSRDRSFRSTQYKVFRKALYNNTTNLDLSKFGFQVVITEDFGHIDRNRYSVIKIQGPSDQP